MKKLVIGSIVGGIIIFIWQTLSWAALNLHHASQEYTPKQDSILSYLNTQFSEDGMKIPSSGFGTIFIACLFIGIIVFINSPYTIHIWYPKADIMIHLLDALVSWALCGIWLGWWLNRKLPGRKTT